MGRPQMKIGCTRLGEAASCFWFLFLVLAGPSDCAEKTSRDCAIFTNNVTLPLACDPGQYITIDAVLAGPTTSDCKVSKECDSPNANFSQVFNCNGQRSCNVSLQLLITCNGTFLPNFAVEILYRCSRSSTHPISSEEFTTESTMSSTERNMSPTESTSGSTLKPTESTSGRTMSPTDSMTGRTKSPTDSMTGSTNSPTESMTGRTISPTDFMTGSTISPTDSMTGSTLKSTESTSGSTISPTESTTGSTILPTESTTGSTMKPTESTSGNSVSPTESTTGSTLLPTESMTGSTMKPTESTSGSTLSTTKSTTESRTNAPSVHSVVVLLVVLVGVMVFTTLLVTCLLCVYRKPWKRDQSSIVSPNTCTHLNHASAPVVANLYSDMTSGDENVVHMSSLENIGPMADSDHWPPLTVRQGHSAVKYSVSRVENGEGGCPGDSAYAQLDIPRRERDSADYWEVEVGEEDSFCVVHSQVNHDDVMLQELTLQKTSQTCHIAASPTDHPPRHLRTCEMGFAGSDNGDVFEESSIYEPLSTFNRLSVRRTDETYTSFEQQELNVKPDIQKTNKSYYFEKEPLYLKNESKAAFDELSYTSENTANPYYHLSRTELRVTFTQDCDLQEQCERSDSIHGRHDDHQTVTEADEDNRNQDVRERTGRKNRHDYFELEAVRFPQYKDASVSPRHEDLPEYIEHTTYHTSGCPCEHLMSATKHVSMDVSDIAAPDISTPKDFVPQTDMTGGFRRRDRTSVTVNPYHHLTHPYKVHGTYEHDVGISVPTNGQTQDSTDENLQDALDQCQIQTTRNEDSSHVTQGNQTARDRRLGDEGLGDEGLSDERSGGCAVGEVTGGGESDERKLGHTDLLSCLDRLDTRL